jgi:putative transcriptional regulator
VIERRLGKLLKDSKRSLYWLAKETGISEQALSNLIKAKTKGIEFETLDRICKTLKCQPGELLVWIADEEKKSGKK